MIPSVNFHLWEPCNMRCKFCFATFQDVKKTILPKGHLPKTDALDVVSQLAEFGFEKITFVGGEPTLCPWLPELIAAAKQEGLTTMIVTNGSCLTEEFLRDNKENLDWIALSVDSLKAGTNIAAGRAISGKTPLLVDEYKSVVDRIEKHGYGLKINTVVSSTNWDENLSEFIRYSSPKRWKVLQVLPIKGQNDTFIDEFRISEEQFGCFVALNSDVNRDTEVVPETNDQIRGSYVMVDPAGRFFVNSTGSHVYSRRITEVGVRLAIQQMNYDFPKFVSRGGVYDWSNKERIHGLT